jgi:hypothetical protein
LPRGDGAENAAEADDWLDIIAADETDFFDCSVAQFELLLAAMNPAEAASLIESYAAMILDEYPERS